MGVEKTLENKGKAAKVDVSKEISPLLTKLKAFGATKSELESVSGILTSIHDYLVNRKGEKMATRNFIASPLASEISMII